jgi:hypothetical protein
MHELQGDPVRAMKGFLLVLIGLGCAMVVSLLLL